VAAQLRGVPRHHDHVARAYSDLLLTSGADVGLARLGGMDPPDIKAERFAGGGQVGDLLELFQLERCTLGFLAPPTASWGGAGHARQVSQYDRFPSLRPRAALRPHTAAPANRPHRYGHRNGVRGREAHGFSRVRQSPARGIAPGHPLERHNGPCLVRGSWQWRTARPTGPSARPNTT